MIDLIGQWRSHWLTAASARVGSGAALVAIANAASTLSLFAVTITIGRLAGASDLGRYGLLVVLGSFLGGIVDMGADRVLAERLGQRSSNWIASLWSVIWLKGFAIGAAMLAGLISLVAGHGQFVLLVVIQAASLTSMLTTQAMAAALHRLPALAIFRISTRLIALLGIVATLVLVASARRLLIETSISWIALADFGCAFGLGAWALRPELVKLGRQSVTSLTIRSTIREGLPLGLASLAVWLYVKLDTLILAAVTDWATLGVYTAAVRLAEVLGGIPTALNSVILPTLAEAWSQDRARFRFMRDSLIALTTTGLGLVSLIVFLLASPIVSGTYHLPNSGPFLKILVWGQVFAASGVVCNAALQVSRQSAAVAHITLVVALVSVPVYLGLIIEFGGAGAAVATTILYFAILPIGLLMRSSRETFLPLLRASAILASALAGAYLGLFLWRQFRALPLLVELPLASVIYLAVVVVWLSMILQWRRRIEDRNIPC